MTPTNLAAAVALELQATGEKATLEDTGGGILCVYVRSSWDEAVFCWGTADAQWGADFYRNEAEYEDMNTDTFIETDIPSDLQDAKEVAARLVVAMKARRLLQHHN